MGGVLAGTVSSLSLGQEGKAELTAFSLFIRRTTPTILTRMRRECGPPMRAPKLNLDCVVDLYKLMEVRSAAGLSFVEKAPTEYGAWSTKFRSRCGSLRPAR